MVFSPPEAEKYPTDPTGLTARLAVYGPSVELQCDVPELQPAVTEVLAPFLVDAWPGVLGLIRGSVRPYDEKEVIRRLPQSAQPLHRPGDLTEIYAHQERFWTIDDRWGMCEINILRCRWQSWVIRQPRLDGLSLFEGSVLHPLAQLLKNRGLHLIPGVSVSNGPTAALLLSGIDLEPELTALQAAGWRVIGRRWTIVREEADHIDLLHVPDMTPRRSDAFGPAARSVDLRPAPQPAFCTAVLTVEAGRRPRAHLRELQAEDAGNVLRRAWPVPELNPNRRQSQFPLRLPQHCPCFQLQLSRDPRDAVSLLDSLHIRPADHRVA